MKPSFQFPGTNGRTSFYPTTRTSRSLQTDCQFHGGGFTGRCTGQPLPPFRRIGEAYFEGEARTHFAMEASVFGLIVLTAAVPVFESIQGLVRFVYGAL